MSNEESRCPNSTHVGYIYGARYDILLLPLSQDSGKRTVTATAELKKTQILSFANVWFRP